MTRTLPMSVRMLISDAESQAKRHGHGKVTPLHLVAAASSRGLAKEQLTEEVASAVDKRLSGIDPDYASPTLDEQTQQLLVAVAAEPDPIEALIARVVVVREPAIGTTHARP